MATDRNFTAWYKHARKVRRGLAEPARCTTCSTDYVSGLDKADEFVLVCFVCGTRTTPGADFWEKL